MDDQSETINIVIETESTALVIRVNDARYPLVIYVGKRLRHTHEYASLANLIGQQGSGDCTGIFGSAYTPSGTRNLLEPAIQVTHADGNPSLDLEYVSHEQTHADQSNDIQVTSIRLKDPRYPFEVTLSYRAYCKDNVIEQWTTIKHTEDGAVRLHKYSSANLYFNSAENYYLTHFHGDWAKEMKSKEIPLTAGIKVLDTKLGARADLFQAPSFVVSFNRPLNLDHEDEGEVFAGTLAWSGNYQIQFEIDPLDNLRLIAGINPYASEYHLAANKEFVTPSFLFTYSCQGLEVASQNWHRWAREHRLIQGEGDRLTLLNNWESTYFAFDEEKLAGLIKESRTLGVDLFLLDDGWFGNKYPRDNDHAGLGDWQVNVKKLPNGIAHLIREAEATGVKFGIWIEPEMVNPKSELYENHPDWVIGSPNRPEYYYRNQLVLDLSNPAVQEFVYSTVDRLFTEQPGLAYIKWDCNAVIYNAYSATNSNQSHLYVDYVHGLYDVLARLRQKYPSVPMMLCSGGGGRMDYGALRYFTEFWPSDNTDGLERIFIQWNYSLFFPAIATCNHVTHWGKQSLKFRTDVAMMGKLGYDIPVGQFDESELAFSQQVLRTYARIKGTIWYGDLYRLVSPFRAENDIASLIYVNQTRDKAIWFTYLVSNRYRAGSKRAIRLRGLDSTKLYRLDEINVYPNTSDSDIVHRRSFSGDYLMSVGFNPLVSSQRASVVLELAEESRS